MLSLHAPAFIDEEGQPLPRDSQQSESEDSEGSTPSPRDSIQNGTARLPPSPPCSPTGTVSRREGLEAALASLLKKHRQTREKMRKGMRGAQKAVDDLTTKMRMNQRGAQETIDDLNAKLKTRDEQLATFKAAVKTNIVEGMDRYTAGLNSK